MQTAELMILDWIQTHFRCEALDTALTFISRLGDHGEIWIVLAAVLLVVRSCRRQGAAVSCALILDLVACNILLKTLINRGRPFLLHPELPLLVPPPGDASFPSGHTAASFAVVFALKGCGSPLWKPALALAAAMAFSRLYLYVHWPSDVLGGILLGAAAGWAGAKMMESLPKGKA